MGLLVDLSPSIKRLHNSGLARGDVGTIRPPDIIVTNVGILCVKCFNSGFCEKEGGFYLSTVNRRGGDRCGGLINLVCVLAAHK